MAADSPADVSTPSSRTSTGKWMALLAALLGWMFDGFEMGLFPVVAAPALKELIGGIGGNSATDFAFWNSLINSGFLIGAAAGGVLFGWLGDRIGRVRAMSLSIITYAVFSGLAGFATAPWHIVMIRFVAALGMGGEWSLGVALVMEVWGGRSRALLAGLIGAAANLGYMLVAVLSFSIGSLKVTLTGWGLSESWVEWRLLMVCGALPALLTFFIRLFVPESEAWEQEHRQGKTSSWATQDLLGVLLGVALCIGLLFVWQAVNSLVVGLVTTLVALVAVAACYLYPIIGYLRRANEPTEVRRLILSRMLLAALISGVPLLATWGAVQWAPAWASDLGKAAIQEDPSLASSARFWKEYTQFSSAFGAVIGSLLGALLAGWIGRRIAYCLLCVTSLTMVLLFYWTNTTVNVYFLTTVFLTGLFTAAFYGWLPLYLPELFPARVRATGQGFGFNFGRIIAAVGVLQLPVLQGTPPNYARACSMLAFIYVVGLAVIWLVPETHGKPLPE